jgi:hypothetical protein
MFEKENMLEEENILEKDMGYLTLPALSPGRRDPMDGAWCEFAVLRLHHFHIYSL